MRHLLGDQIAEEIAKITVMRVLDANGPKSRGVRSHKRKGLGSRLPRPYDLYLRNAGRRLVFGEGQGVYLTADGIAAWKVQGTGLFNPGGGVSYHGAIHYVSAEGSLAKLAGTVGAFEFSTDADDNTIGKVWEWK